MSSTNRVQKMSKVFKILAMIVFYVSIVGAVMLLVTTIAFAVTGNSAEIQEIFSQAGVTVDHKTIVWTCAVLTIECVSTIVLSFYNVRFYKFELEKGTPYNKDVIKKMWNLGLIQIFVPLGVGFVCELILTLAIVETSLVDYSGFTLGVIYLIVSVVLKSGLEKIEQNDGHVQVNVGDINVQKIEPVKVETPTQNKDENKDENKDSQNKDNQNKEN